MTSPAPRRSGKRNPDQTRHTLLQAAFEEIHQQGFQAASLETILATAGVTKGARRPTLQQVLKDPQTQWTSVTVTHWYGGGAREVAHCTDTAV
jgi:hypothetical protein